MAFRSVNKIFCLFKLQFFFRSSAELASIGTVSSVALLKVLLNLEFFVLSRPKKRVNLKRGEILYTLCVCLLEKSIRQEVSRVFFVNAIHLIFGYSRSWGKIELDIFQVLKQKFAFKCVFLLARLTIF